MIEFLKYLAIGCGLGFGAFLAVAACILSGWISREEEERGYLFEEEQSGASEGAWPKPIE